MFAIFLACLTITLLLAGALVTSNEAGDSVPDWPMSFGRWVIGSDQFVQGVRYEYSHRVMAGMVGVATFVLAAWAYFGERRKWVRRLALLALVGVIAQALIGGVRVLFPAYKPHIAIPHALVAQSFFGLIVSIAVFTSRSWWRAREIKPDLATPSLRRLTSAAIIVVLIQLMLGAGFRHQAFGIIPHIAGAVAVTITVVWTALAVLRRHRAVSYLRRPALTALALLTTQLVLGVLAYLARLHSSNDPQPLEPMISLTVAHLVVGALTLASLIVLALRCHQVLTPSRAGAKGVAGSPKEIRSSARRATA